MSKISNATRAANIAAALEVADEVNGQAVKTEAEYQADAEQVVESDNDAQIAAELEIGRREYEDSQIQAEQWFADNEPPAWCGDFDDIYGGNYSEE